MSNLKKIFINGFVWSFSGQIGYLLISLSANVILARLLTPSEFGQVAIVMFFIVMSKVLTESGLTGALVRKKDATEDDFSTVFIFNLSISIFLVLILIFSSGFISDFYGIKELKNVLICLSSILIINAFQFTQNARIIKEMKFKRKAFYALVSVIVSSFLGIALAILNYGIWALVFMQICNALLLTVLYWVFEGGVQKYIFAMESFKDLYKFGVNTTLASLINSIFDNIYTLILGKYFSIQSTGLFYQAKKLQEIPVGVINTSTLGVVFSTLSKLQDDKEEFELFYDKIVKIFTTLVGLICLLLFIYAEQVVMLLYGEKWMKIAFFMKVLIISSFFNMQEFMNRILFKVFNRTDKILYLEFVKKMIQLSTIIIGIYLKDLNFLLYGFLFSSIMSYFINSYHLRKIYLSSSGKEIIMVTKVMILGIFVALLFNVIISQIVELDGYISFLFFPVVIIFYFYLVKIFNVLNILSEIRLFIIDRNS